MANPSMRPPSPASSAAAQPEVRPSFSAACAPETCTLPATFAAKRVMTTQGAKATCASLSAALGESFERFAGMLVASSSTAALQAAAQAGTPRPGNAAPCIPASAAAGPPVVTGTAGGASAAGPAPVQAAIPQSIPKYAAGSKPEQPVCLQDSLPSCQPAVHAQPALSSPLQRPSDHRQALLRSLQLGQFTHMSAATAPQMGRAAAQAPAACQSQGLSSSLAWAAPAIMRGARAQEELDGAVRQATFVPATASAAAASAPASAAASADTGAARHGMPARSAGLPEQPCRRQVYPVSLPEQHGASQRCPTMSGVRPGAGSQAPAAPRAAPAQPQDQRAQPSMVWGIPLTAHAPAGAKPYASHAPASAAQASPHPCTGAAPAGGVLGHRPQGPQASWGVQQQQQFISQPTAKVPKSFSQGLLLLAQAAQPESAFTVIGSSSQAAAAVPIRPTASRPTAGRPTASGPERYPSLPAPQPPRGMPLYPDEAACRALPAPAEGIFVQHSASVAPPAAQRPALAAPQTTAGRRIVAEIAAARQSPEFGPPRPERAQGQASPGSVPYMQALPPRRKPAKQPEERVPHQSDIPEVRSPSGGPLSPAASGRALFKLMPGLVPHGARQLKVVCIGPMCQVGQTDSEYCRHKALVAFQAEACLDRRTSWGCEICLHQGVGRGGTFAYGRSLRYCVDAGTRAGQSERDMADERALSSPRAAGEPVNRRRLQDILGSSPGGRVQGRPQGLQ